MKIADLVVLETDSNAAVLRFGLVCNTQDVVQVRFGAGEVPLPVGMCS